MLSKAEYNNTNIKVGSYYQPLTWSNDVAFELLEAIKRIYNWKCPQAIEIIVDDKRSSFLVLGKKETYLIWTDDYGDVRVELEDRPIEEVALELINDIQSDTIEWINWQFYHTAMERKEREKRLDSLCSQIKQKISEKK